MCLHDRELVFKGPPFCSLNLHGVSLEVDTYCTSYLEDFIVNLHFLFSVLLDGRSGVNGI